MRHLPIIFIILLPLIGCGEKQMDIKPVKLPRLNNIPQSAWEMLSRKKIYFGHQSVGFNIIDGIKDILNENSQISLSIVETTNPNDFNAPIFAHSRVGQNTDPHSKCDAFAKLIQKDIGKKVDIAFFKFCFVDIMSNTNPHKIFDYYKNTLTSLQSQYPTIQFIPVTIPLVTVQKGIKSLIKKLINRPIGVYEDNIKRNQLNKLIGDYYNGKQPIFDLALFESTYPNGSRSFFSKDNKIYFALTPEYSYDGGHLNEAGRRHVAEQLLIILTQL